ncbi:uncharacterized protein LOC113468632 isoform X2 [Diaphorina citri]|uniref:Uncharacterized protein LOC113468632 isoform X2 n=1 Tax=Diaphorina citri TaxID=121845 RepID=A0A3Q0J469_DIACI|nr:uncharacterized protein LOC113468632 isoform X2 [Diaphorina citri]
MPKDCQRPKFINRTTYWRKKRKFIQESNSNNRIFVQGHETINLAETAGCESSCFGCISPENNEKLGSDFNIQNFIVDFALKTNQTHSNINFLLNGLKKHSCFKDLPNDARTLLKTPREDIKKLKVLEPGFYYHFGIQYYVTLFLSKVGFSENIELCIGIDGLPLTDSSRSVFWPILGYVWPSKTNIFVIGLYWGLDKPKSSNEYLSPFVEEMKRIQDEGFDFQGKKVCVGIKFFACDSPAKSFILNIKGHAGYSSCTRCFSRGERLNGRTCFPVVVGKKRSHENFILREDSAHHLENKSVLLELDIDMIRSFPLDYMHVVCLGVIKKLLLLLTCSAPVSLRIDKRKRGNEISDWTKINNLIELCRLCLPQDFSRKSRPLEDIKHWKATEFRLFLVYVGPIVLKDNIDKIQFDNFLSLHIAIKILSSKMFDKLSNYAFDLLKYFVRTFSEIYGNHLISHNVHALLHIKEDYQKFGCLDNYSCFPFENYLGQLKKKLRHCNKPLEQIVNRTIELQINNNLFKDESNLYGPCKAHTKGPICLGVRSDTQYSKLKTVSCTLFVNRIKKSDSYIITKNLEIVQIENFVKTTTEELLIIGFRFQSVKDVFETPIKSSRLLEFVVDEINENLEVWKLSDLLAKCIVFTVQGKKFAIGLAHTISVPT